MIWQLNLFASTTADICIVFLQLCLNLGRSALFLFVLDVIGDSDDVAHVVVTKRPQPQIPAKEARASFPF